MIIDGKEIARELLAQVRTETAALARSPSFLALAVAPSFATQSYLKMKRAQAEQVGITMEVRAYERATTEDLIAAIKGATEDAIIVQLPLPDPIDARAVLDAIPVEKDADALSVHTREQFPERHPVAAAIREVLARGSIDPAGKRATVVGKGWLVGAPAAAWLTAAGAQVTVVTREEGDLRAALKSADIIVSGAGVAGLIGKEDVRPGAAVIDIGTSELGGSVAGDVRPEVADVASLFTPVPGGMGPITVAFLMKNVVTSSRESQLRNGG